jgi:hypothetical protein
MLILSLVVVLLWQVSIGASSGQHFHWPSGRLANSNNAQFEDELRKVSDYATSLRSGVKCCFDGSWFEGRVGVVAKLKFEDNIEWAMKIEENPPPHDSLEEMTEAIESSKAIERYCPELLIPKVHGELQTLLNSTLVYYLMDWVEGEPIHKIFEPPWSEVTQHGNLNFTIPETTLFQLAEYFYNLTVCQIPEEESKILLVYQVVNLCSVKITKSKILEYNIVSFFTLPDRWSPTCERLGKSIFPKLPRISLTQKF